MSREESIGSLVNKLVNYVVERLERTWFFSLRFAIPSRVVSPLSYLGMLTFVIFLIEGITGGILMFYYVPTLDGAWDSVARINDEIPFGYILRNVHYHGSNAMVFLAVFHLYYQFFSGRYKLRYEMLWVTGIILGLMTVLEAFFGYDVIFNERAELALSIGASLAENSPVIGVVIREAVFGAGFGDFILRSYTYHVFILPVVMILLIILHFPRNMIMDIPMISAITGGIFIVGGLFPIELGGKFGLAPPTITVPEWYLTGIYAFIRTGFDRFITGGLMPALLLLMFIVMPFVDKGKKYRWQDRPLFTALGVTSLGQIAVTTVWGFYIDPDTSLPFVDRIFIDPFSLWMSMLLIAFFSFVGTYSFIKVMQKSAEAKKVAKKPPFIVNAPVNISQKWIWVMLVSVILFMVYLNLLAFQAYESGFHNLALLELGGILVSFSAVFHLYRYAKDALMK